MLEMKRGCLFVLLSCLLWTCNPSDDIVSNNENEEDVLKELKLSIEGAKDIGNKIDYEFDILDGNGEYTAEASCQPDGDVDAKVVIEDHKVKVNLLNNQASITISDKRQQSQSVVLVSSAESLVPIDYGFFIDNGDTYTMKNISFGVGGYSVKKLSGSSVDVTVDENDFFKIVALTPGNSYYKLIDKRGTTAKLDIKVVAQKDLTENTVEITAVNDQIVDIWLKYGNGDWELEAEPESPLIEKVYLKKKADVDKKYDILQVNTAKGDHKGLTTIRLKDTSGNIASIILKIV